MGQEIKDAPPDAVVDERAPTLDRTDYVLGPLCGLVGLATMLPMVWATRPGYLTGPDCVPYIVQAHTFASGYVTRPAPPRGLSSFFQTTGLFECGGRELSRQPPGASAVFALVMSVTRDIRLAPPVVSALVLVLTYLWVRRAYDRRIALTTIALCLLASHYTLICCSPLSYAPSSLFFAAAMLMLTCVLSRSSIPAALACGLFIGLQFTVRPFTAVLTSLALAILYMGIFRERPRTSRLGPAFSAGLLIGVTLLLVHNRIVTHTWWPLAFSLSEPNDRLGFGVRGMGSILITHTPERAVKNLAWTLHTMGVGFFWCYASMIPMFVWWIGRAIRRGRSGYGRLTRWDWALIVLIAVPPAGHMAYWYPRNLNYFEVYPVYAALISRGIWYMAGNGRVLRYVVPVLLSLIVCRSIVVMSTWTAERVPPALPPVYRQIERNRDTHGKLLVFISGTSQLGHPLTQSGNDVVIPDWFNSSMSPEPPVIYAIDRGEENDRLIVHYPDRHPCIIRNMEVTSLDRSRGSGNRK